MTSMGEVKSFNPVKGWGFISCEGQDLFMHVKDCVDGVPQQGDQVKFDLEEDPVRTGQMKALNISGCSLPKEAAGKGGGMCKGKGKGKGGGGGGSCSGTVKSFNDQKGWGFIDLDGTDIFLHARDCQGCRPVTGDWLTFDVREDPTKGGRRQAANVTGGTGRPNDGGGKGGGGMMGGMGGKGAYGPMWGGGWGGWGMGPYGYPAIMSPWDAACMKGYGKWKGGW